MSTPKIEKVSLGDSVYVHFDGFHVVLTTDPGHEWNNAIYLVPRVVAELLRYIEQLKAKKEAT